MPFRIDTPTLFAMVFGVLGPVKAATGDRCHRGPLLAVVGAVRRVCRLAAVDPCRERFGTFTLFRRARGAGTMGRASRGGPRRTRLRKEGDMNIANILATKGGEVFTIRPELTVRQAVGLLAEHNIGALVAVDAGGQPIGILSERDVVRCLARADKLLDEPVAAIMTRDVVVASSQDDLRSVGWTMTERRIRHLPVVDRGKLVGIVSIGDIVKAQRDRLEGEVDTLQVQLIESQRDDEVFKHR
jgi:CBS domain-containing protein